MTAPTRGCLNSQQRYLLGEIIRLVREVVEDDQRARGIRVPAIRVAAIQVTETQ